MNRERRPGMELPFDTPSSVDYDRLSGVPIFTFERSLFMRKLRHYSPRGKLLDVGCGPGSLLFKMRQFYPNLILIGLDINKDVLKLAARKFPLHEVELIRADAEDMPLGPCSIDFVISSLSLHHWSNPCAVFWSIRRVLRPGGRFLMLDFRRDAPWPFYTLAHFANLLAPASIKRTRGALGSLYTSYTAEELSDMLLPMNFGQIEITKGLGWMFVTGIKK